MKKKIGVGISVILLTSLAAVAGERWWGDDERATNELTQSVLSQWSQVRRLAGEGVRLERNSLRCLATDDENNGPIGTCTIHSSDAEGYAVDYFHVLEVLPGRDGKVEWSVRGPFQIHED